MLNFIETSQISYGVFCIVYIVLQSYFVGLICWKRFIQGRVVQIRNNLPDIKWLHCPGVYNPADIPSRGLDISKNEIKMKWLCGPQFLFSLKDSWPEQERLYNKTGVMKEVNCIDDVEEQSIHLLSNAHDNLQKENVEGGVTCILTSMKEGGLNNIITANKYSNIQKLFRVTCYRVATILESPGKSWN